MRKREQAAHETLFCERGNRQVQLTRRGQRLLRLTRPCVEAEAQIARRLADAGAVPAGELRTLADAALRLAETLVCLWQRRDLRQFRAVTEVAHSLTVDATAGRRTGGA